MPLLWINVPTFFLSNVTSLPSKVDKLVLNVQSIGADVVCITEAWQIVPELCHSENFILFHQFRENIRGGGLALFAWDKYRPQRLIVGIPERIKVLWVRVTPPFHPRLTASIIYSLARGD